MITKKQKTTIVMSTFAIAIVVASFGMSKAIGEGFVLPSPESTTQPTSEKVPSLTNSELQTAVQILKEDSNAQKFLNESGWNIMLSGPWIEDGEKRGAALKIKFEQSFWSKGDFWDPSTERKMHSSQWIRTMDAFVDLNDKELISIVPGGLTRPPSTEATKNVDLPAQAKDAKSIAIQHEPVQSMDNPESQVIGIMNIENSGENMVIYRFFDDKQEVLVAVDLSTMQVIEKHSGMVMGQ